MRRFSLPAVALMSASLLLAGCGGDDSSSPAAPESSTSSSPAAPKVPETWPLTGLTVKSGQTASLDHPVLVTKMDNTEASAPQVGLGSADLVVEELVEGGLTRLAAFFYSDVPKTVGPVRSMRASDIGIVSPVGATVVTSGAAAKTIALINQAKIPFKGEGTQGFYRDSSRMAPYNLFAHLTEVADGVKTKKPARPDDYLPWGKESGFKGTAKAGHISAQFSGGHTTQWRYGAGHYINENSNAPEGDQFPADTVLVLRVKIGDAGYLDPAGNPVPETKLVGKGAALIFHDGKVMKATWQKKKLDSPISLSNKKGKVTVPAGHTWIELVPAANGDVTFTKK